MMTFSTLHWIILAILLLGVVWPLALVLRRAGFSPWWCLLALLGFVGVPIILWMLALQPWPRQGAGIGTAP